MNLVDGNFANWSSLADDYQGCEKHKAAERKAEGPTWCELLWPAETHLFSAAGMMVVGMVVAGMMV